MRKQSQSSSSEQLHDPIRTSIPASLNRWAFTGSIKPQIRRSGLAAKIHSRSASAVREGLGMKGSMVLSGAKIKRPSHLPKIGHKAASPPASVTVNAVHGATVPRTSCCGLIKTCIREVDWRRIIHFYFSEDLKTDQKMGSDWGQRVKILGCIRRAARLTYIRCEADMLSEGSVNCF